MRRIPLLLALSALPFAGWADDVPVIRVIDLGGGAYRLTLTSFSISNLAEAQAALLPKANELCGDKTPQFGKYEYGPKEGTDNIGNPMLTAGKLTLVQEIRCEVSIAAAQPVQAADPDPNWKPSDDEYKSVYAAISRYFAAKDKGDAIATYAMLDEAAQQNITFKQWVIQSDQFTAEVGASVSHWVVKYNWYKNPRGAPEPGVYVSADFVDHYKNVDADCGGVSLHEQDDGSFRVMNETHGSIPLNSKQIMTPEALTALKIKLNCAAN